MWDCCYKVKPANVAWLINYTIFDYQYHMTVLSISADLGNVISDFYKSEGLVCPRQLRRGVFTTAAYDNIDHNPSANTALGVLHGTAISLFQHPCHTNSGEARIIESHVSSSHQEKRHFQKSTQMVHHWFC